ncbi:MAG: hypothetical protein ABEJ65_01555 [bacterium]
MFYLRLIIILFVGGTFNVFALVLVHTLPALQGMHAKALAVTAAFLMIADVILLYLMFFRFPSMLAGEDSEEFEDYLERVKSGEEATQEEFDEAYKRWQKDL